MKPLDGCHGCYDTSFTVQCTGNVLRTRVKVDEEENNVISPNEVTASSCIQLGGQCCDPRSPLQLCEYIQYVKYGNVSWEWIIYISKQINKSVVASGSLIHDVFRGKNTAPIVSQVRRTDWNATGIYYNPNRTRQMFAGNLAGNVVKVTKD